MQKFETLKSLAIPIDQVNVDTDQIVPARFLRKPRGPEYAQYCFHDRRHVLDEKNYPGAQILVAGRNFGCGSSREQAVWALWYYGIRACIAPSFGDIFHSNALKNGLLPIVLPVENLIEEAKAKKPFTIDLASQLVNGKHRFDVAPFAKKCMLEGLDEIDYTLTLADKIAAFEKGIA